MKKPEVNPKIYEAWDNKNRRIEERKRQSIFGVALEQWDDVYQVTEAVLHGQKMTGRSRKMDEDLILVPRFVLKWLIDAKLMEVAGKKKGGDPDGNARRESQEADQ